MSIEKNLNSVSLDNRKNGENNGEKNEEKAQNSSNIESEDIFRSSLEKMVMG